MGTRWALPAPLTWFLPMMASLHPAFSSLALMSWRSVALMHSTQQASAPTASWLTQSYAWAQTGTHTPTSQCTQMAAAFSQCVDEYPGCSRPPSGRLSAACCAAVLCKAKLTVLLAQSNGQQLELYQAPLLC